MTELLDRAIAKARHLPPQVQDEIAWVVMDYVEEESAVELSEDDERAIAQAKAAAARGEFASDDDVRAIWAKHGL